MKPFIFATFAAIGLSVAFTPLASFANAAPTPEHLRGTIASITPQSLVIHTRDDKDVTVILDDQTSYSAVVKSSLDDITEGSYIGTATKTIGSKLIALEVSIFPPEMRGAGEGHYAWDKIADTTLAAGAATASAMTNGNVTTVASSGKTDVNSAMTNGNVATAAAKGGLTVLNVTYKGGKQTVLVPPTAPVVALQIGSKADLATGAAVFVVALKDGTTTTAKLVAVGKGGVIPPM
ncbi:hypothetical protein [Thalassospira mesophila]|uniref:Metal ABC transporter permease n=1 Tax=Thalassospira mesophila TaxID=1293891 RepID=A0A1Y2L5C5_9PROT|nr:hypothetical protein [Thalassospira mesophila]OSQ39733.1 hypothetical protein TMES_07170 [Thalassospira mesophila]